jgi:sialic acid synthase
VVAEIGCNHAGDLQLAKRMMAVAAEFCEVDAVKFQKRRPSTLLTRRQYEAPHPEPRHAFGSTYGEHREFLEFDVDQHKELAEHAAYLNVDYSSSVWDLPSARDIVKLAPTFVKIPSATNLNFDLLRFLCAEHAGDIHLSLGMTTVDEEDRIFGVFDAAGRAGSLVLYACTSGYPVPFADLCLLEINRLREKFAGRVKAVGFSGHHLGIAADVAAMTLGAEFVERHFTLDRTSKGTDHAASLEPDGLRKLVRDLTNVSASLTYKQREILDVERVAREKLKWQQR